MKRQLRSIGSIILAVLISSSPGCKDGSSTPTDSGNTDTTHSHPIVRKPNVYLYPQFKTTVSVKLEFPLGGTVIESTPSYAGEWRVEVEPNGRIDDKYDYLFYESQTPDAYQYVSGWVVNKDSLLGFFQSNLSEMGFNRREINDFTEYWIPKLTESRYYIIYPQFANDIDKMIRLKVAPSPDNLLRLFYVITGSERTRAALSTPKISKFQRQGFVVAEWGVVLK